MVARILEEVNETLDEKGVGEDKRYEALMEEVGVHSRKMQDPQEW